MAPFGAHWTENTGQPETKAPPKPKEADVWNDYKELHQAVTEILGVTIRATNGQITKDFAVNIIHSVARRALQGGDD